MVTVHEEYLVDDKGEKKAVVIPLAEWARILEEMEELDDIKAYEVYRPIPGPTLSRS